MVTRKQLLEKLRTKKIWTNIEIGSMIGAMENSDLQPTVNESNTQTIIETHFPLTQEIIQPPVPAVIEVSPSLDLVNKRYYQVAHLRKYDIIHAKNFGFAYFVVVLKVKKDLVWGLTVTSKVKHHSIMEIKRDRRLQGSFFTNTIIAVPLVEAINSFVGVYECRNEAREAISIIKEQLKGVL